MLRIVDESRRGVLICRMEGRLDGTTSSEADAHLTASTAKPEGARVVLDCGPMSHLSSAGLRVILTAAKRAQADQRRLALASPQPYILEILEIAGLTSILEIHSTTDAAVDALCG